MMDKNWVSKNWYRIVAALILLGGLGAHPYSYYDFLRWATCAAAFYTAYALYDSKSFGWMWVFVGIGILFNPIAPFYMSRGNWQPIDLGAAVLFVVAAFIAS